MVDLRTVAAHPGFRRLFTVRLVSQCGDGLFQAGLATLFFFSPQNLATAGAVAAAFAVLLLPFTIVGPFAGPLLDRWRRRQVLLGGNALRVALAAVLALLMATGGVSIAVYALALLTLMLNRFLLAALSAGLPRVVPREQLLIANTLSPTLGAAAAAVGATVGFLLELIGAPGRGMDGLVLIVAAAFFAAAALLALRLGKDQLGPDRTGSHDLGVDGAVSDIASIAADVVAGARYLVARRTPAMALGVMAVHRFLYGINFIALILISRNLLNDPAATAAGLATFGLLTGISFAGNGLAIVLTPLAQQRITPATWVVVCLMLGALSQTLMATAPVFWLIAAAAVLMGLAVQGAKIAVDTIVHADTADEFRGRAFSLYDTLYNGAFAGAATMAAAVLPDTGWSRGALAALVVLYLIVALGYAAGNRALNGSPRQV